MEVPKFESNNGVEHLIENSDISIDRKSGLAVVVIKPDAFASRDLIIKRLEGSGLYIAKTVSKRLPVDFVLGEMYKNLPEGIEEETAKHFSSGPSEIILVKGGDDILQKIVSVTGEKLNPNECDEESIRYLFGEHFGRDASEGKTYFRNAAHRGKDEEERLDDLDKFESFL
ncbi:MAG: nucleoside-diphosphate kinase [Candidatus Paceibacterota bacterium]|jgi:nucleoside diphosphate kinase